MNPTLLVLAAGLGSRYGGLKQIDPMGPHSETLLDYSVFDAIRAGFGRVVFVIRTDFADEFKSRVGDRFVSFIPVDYAFQSLDQLPGGLAAPEGRTKPWGTGQAVLAAAAVIKENFCVINADDFYGCEAYVHMARLLRPSLQPTEIPLLGSMVGYRLRQTLSLHGSVSRGICRQDADGRLLSVQEMTRIFATERGAENREEGQTAVTLSGEEIVSLNFWGLTPAFFTELETLFGKFLQENGHSKTAEFYLPLAIDHLIARDQARIQVVTSESPWYGVTYREDKPVVQRALQAMTERGDYPQPLFALA